MGLEFFMESWVSKESNWKQNGLTVEAGIPQVLIYLRLELLKAIIYKARIPQEFRFLTLEFLNGVYIFEAGIPQGYNIRGLNSSGVQVFDTLFLQGLIFLRLELSYQLRISLLLSPVTMLLASILYYVLVT